MRVRWTLALGAWLVLGIGCGQQPAAPSTPPKAEKLPPEVAGSPESALPKKK